MAARGDCAVDFSPGGVWIGYIRPVLWDRSLIDAAPVTGSLVSSALFDCLDVYCAAGFTSCLTFCRTDCVLLAGFVLSLQRVGECGTMTTNGVALAEDRVGITFGVELYVPWDAPEAVVDISSEGVVPLRHIPDVIGLVLVGRREGAAESCVLQGRDVRSVRVLVLDPRGVDQNFHDVTIVDMGDVPESSISIPELSTLSQQWSPAVISHMGWRQQELEGMRVVAKQRFRQSRPSSCVYCGIWIKCDMYRHVARFHLDLAQLWRCPVSWCSVWKGTPQDCMDHIRGTHDVPWEIKSASLEHFLPPWTVTPLPDPQARSPACRLPEEILVSAACAVAFAGGPACGWGGIAHPARVRYDRLGLRKSWKSRPGRPDVPTDGGDQYV